VVYNDGVNTLNVYPAASCAIDNAAQNVPVTIARFSTATYQNFDGADWVTVAVPIVGGTGITVTYGNGQAMVSATPGTEVTSITGTPNEITANASTGAVTLSTPATFIAPGTIQDSTGMIYSTTVAVTAAGTNQSTATQLTTSYNVITTAASGTGVILPAVIIGLRVVVTNNGANTLQVYPPQGRTIDGVSSAGVSLPVGASATYEASGTFAYLTVDPPVVAGTGLIVTYGNGQTVVSISGTGEVVSISGTPNQIAASASSGAVTLSTPAIFIAPGTIQDSTGMLYSTNASVSAAGSAQGNATVLAKSYNVITTVASGTGVVLPVVTTAGLRVVIVNKGVNTLNVYPAASAAIDSAGSNIAVTLPVGGTVTYEAASATQWYTVDAPLVGGSGITITYSNGQTLVSVSGTGEVVSISGTPNQITASASVGAVTLSTPAVFIAPGTIQDTTGMRYSTTLDIVANGTTQTDATPLNTSFNIVFTVASGTGVRLPSDVIGLRVVVYNFAVNTLNVYPATSSSIDFLAPNLPVTLPSHAAATYQNNGGEWFTVDAPLVAGTGITVTYGNGQTLVALSGTGTVASIAGTPNQITASASTGAVTLSTPAVFIAPGTIQDTTGMLYSTNAAVSAAGSTQAGATVLAKSYNVITSVGSGTGVSLPSLPTAGLRVVVVNKGLRTLAVYPAPAGGGGIIDGAAVNASVALAVGGTATYEAASSTQWYTVDAPLVGGSGITVTYGNGQTTVSVSGTGEVVSIAGTPNQITASASTGAVTLSTPAVFIAPGTIQDTTGMIYSTSAAVTAQGSTQGTATVITTSYNVLTTVANSSVGVVLPSLPTPGYRVVLVNKGAAAVNVYPASAGGGGKIDSAGANASVTLAVGASVTYEAASTTQWYTVNAPIVAGSGITVTYSNGKTVVATAGATGVTSVTGTPNQVAVNQSTGDVTISTPAVFIAPGTIQDTTGMLYSTNAAVVAQGSTQGTATLLTKSYNVVTSVANSTVGVVLPLNPTPGLISVVVNAGPTLLHVYPNVGAIIDDLTTNTAVTLASSATSTYIAASSTQWYSLRPSLTTGGGITISYSSGHTVITNTGVQSVAGTPNQITSSAATGAITLSTPAVFIAPGTIQDTTGMIYSTSAAVTAQGSTQGTATPLTTSYNVITTVANSSVGVVLQSLPTPGYRVVVVNKGAATLNVYPAAAGGGGIIDSAATNASVTLAVGASATYEAASSTQWYTVDAPIVAGSGITVTYGNGQTTVATSGGAGVTSITGHVNQITASASTGAVTLTTPATFIAPGTIQDTTGMLYSTTATIVANGTIQAQATPLTTSFNVLTTVVFPNTGVILQTPSAAGYIVVVINRGSGTAKVYPAVGGTIDSLASNAAVSIGSGYTLIFQAASTTQWYTQQPNLVSGGAGLSVGYSNGQQSIANTGVTSLSGTPNQVAASASTGAVTLTTPAVFIAPGTIQDTTGMLYSTNAAVSAAGSNQAGATALSKSYNVITLVGSGTGVVLPSSPTAGFRVVVVNKGQNTLNVYPASASGGGFIDSAAINAAVTLPVGGTATYQASNGTQWYTVNTPIVAGSGITVTYGNGQTLVAASGATGVTSITGTPNQVAANASTGAVTLSTPAIFIAPGTIQDTTGMLYSLNPSVSAAGTTQGTATLLSKSYNVVTGVTGGNTGVRLPLIPPAGMRVVVSNQGSVTMTVWPASGAQIDNAGTDVGVLVPAGAAATYQASTGNQWFTVDQPVIAGTGLSATYAFAGVTTLTNTGVTSISGTGNQITASASTGPVTLSIPAVFIAPGTLAATSGTFSSSLLSTCLLANDYTTYSTGTASQSGTTISGSGTTFSLAHVGGVIKFASGQCASIMAFVNASTLTTHISQTVGSGSFVIYYGGFQTSHGETSLNRFMIQNGQTTEMTSPVSFMFKGVDGSVPNGPTTQWYTSADKYSLAQSLMYTHDNMAYTMDGYLDTNADAWISSSIAANYQIYKLSGALSLNYATGFAPGSAITWGTGATLSNTGTVTLGHPLPPGSGGTGSSATVVNNMLLVGSGGNIVSSTIDQTTVAVMTSTSNTVSTTSAWTAGNAHSITAFVKKVGTTVTCRLLDNTGFTPIDTNDFIIIPLLIPSGYRPFAGATYMSQMVLGPNSAVGAFYAIDGAGNVFIYRAVWNGAILFNSLWVPPSNMAVSSGSLAPLFTWTTD
jgi:hypothetical protein